jgi:hypothetical protein
MNLKDRQINAFESEWGHPCIDTPRFGINYHDAALYYFLLGANWQKKFDENLIKRKQYLERWRV